MPSRNRGRGGGGGGGLTQALDREVYQVVRKIIDVQEQFGGEGAGASVTPAKIYDEIRRLNSSLNRKPKKLLQDSIERVISTIQQDIAGSESETLSGEFGDLEQDITQEQPPSNGLNKNIVGQWSTAPSTASATPDHNMSQVSGLAVEKSVKRKASGEPLPKRKKPATTTSTDRSPPTHPRLSDLAGIDHVISQFLDLLVIPLLQPEIYTSLHIKPPRGVLMYGPPGCGKTMIAHAVAAEIGVNFIPISAPSIVSGVSGESEKAIRDYFEEAVRCAPCLMFIDEIDVIAHKRESAHREMDKRMVAQLSICMDDLGMTHGKPVVVLAATNRPDTLDPALRRGGRFGKEIIMPVPSEPIREQILRALTRGMTIDSDVDFPMLAQKTPGYVGADLSDLVTTAGTICIDRHQDLLASQAQAMEDESQMSVDQPVSSISAPTASFRCLVKYIKEHSTPAFQSSDSAFPIRINLDHFLTALPRIQPSALREGFATVPSTTFADIGSLSTHISELTNTIIRPILHPTIYSDLGITPSSGTLLWGPPGNGKTLLAKAVANSSHANFISVKGPELLNKYVGESERAVRQLFSRARASVPVIIFFDELDALVPRREGAMSEASARVVNTMLVELDGIGDGREGIYVIGATNRPDVIDPAMLRPGRMETLLFVGLPDAEGRVDILKTLCKRLKRFSFTDDIANIARRCERFSGADLEALLRRAGNAAMKRCSSQIDVALANRGEVGQSMTRESISVVAADFESAMEEVGPSVSLDDMKGYARLQQEWGRK